jgi:hypothetical protein
MATVDDKRVDDLEYRIGLTGLLRGGAVVIIIAIIYLVALAVSRGYITPQIQFAGEIALCFAFIALGCVKRNEREEFGQLMAGIGSCGLYLSFAGGHLYKHLYAGETLVTLFVALSFANLGFALWRSSRSFLAIGMLGGLTAAMLPMHQYKPVLDIDLHFLILLPTAFIVIKNRWRDMAVAVWGASTAALIPALTYDGAWMLRVGALYGTSLICAGTYAKVWSENRFDPWCALSGVMLGVAGIGALAFDGVQHGSLHVLLLAGASLAVGYAFRSNAILRNAFWLAGLAIAVTLAPVGYHRLEAGSAFALLSIAISFAAFRAAPKPLTSLAALLLALGLCAYTAPWTNSPVQFSIGAETWLLTAFMTATAACAFACVRAGGASEPLLLVAAVVLLPLFARLGFVLLTSPSIAFMTSIAVLLPFMVFAAAVLVIGNSAKWKRTVIFGCGVLVLAFLQYIQVVGDGFESPSFDSILVLGLISASLYAAQAVKNVSGKESLDWIVAAAGGIVSAFVLRLSLIWLTLPVFRLHLAGALTIGLLIVTFASGLLSLRFKWRGLTPQGWVTLLAASLGALGIQVITHYGVSFELSLTTMCILATLLQVRAASRTLGPVTGLAGFAVGLIWVLFSRWAYVVLTSGLVGIKDAPALTLAWIVYAVALMVLGFGFQARYIRYWSFGVFGTTLVKIFAYDLSALDPGIRVVILMAIGVGMVGAGYWYIRSRPAEVVDGSDGAVHPA